MDRDTPRPDANAAPRERRNAARRVIGIIFVVVGMGSMVGLIAFAPVSLGISFEVLTYGVVGSAALALAGLALT